MAIHHTHIEGGEGADKQPSAVRASMGPQIVDQMIGQAVSSCWMLLPDDRRNVQGLKDELQRILNRAIANFEEDAKAFRMDL